MIDTSSWAARARCAMSAQTGRLRSRKVNSRDDDYDYYYKRGEAYSFRAPKSLETASLNGSAESSPPNNALNGINARSQSTGGYLFKAPFSVQLLLFGLALHSIKKVAPFLSRASTHTTMNTNLIEYKQPPNRSAAFIRSDRFGPKVGTIIIV